MLNFLNASRYFLCCTLWFSAATGFADHLQQERILNFDNAITINQDASINSTETITVHAEQQKIRHGIVRRLPTRYTDTYGVQHHTQYHIQKILLNGEATNYHIQNSSHDVSVYIGDKNTLLPAGDYTYTIAYRVQHAINFLKDADELYWNITGNEWEFAIDHASATITLPPRVNFEKYTAYTGAKGQTNQNYIAQLLSPNVLQFSTTEALQIGEGLTIAATWPKGFVQQPSVLTTFKDFYAPSLSELILLLMTAMVFGYLLLMWFVHGRDPVSGPIIPLFTSPENLSPAAIRFIKKMKFDSKGMTAAIVNMAVKHALHIDEQAGVITLVKKILLVPEEQVLAPEEIAIDRALFAKGDQLTLTPEYAATKYAKAIKDAAKSLQAQFANKYFVNNFSFMIPAYLFSVVIFLAAVATANDASSAFSGLLSFCVWVALGYFLISVALSKIRLFLAFKTFSNFISALFHSFFIFMLIAVSIIFIVFGTEIVSIYTWLILGTLMIIDIYFYYLLKRYTIAGRKVADEIAGFKMFLGTTEKYRLNTLHPIQQTTTDQAFIKTPETFEKYLPYAIALDVENEWGEQFSDVLTASTTESGQTYQPTWYSGSAFNAANVGSFPAHLDSGLNAALSSVSSSSSASSGGGSSGGGGGGGGGGGW